MTALHRVFPDNAILSVKHSKNYFCLSFPSLYFQFPLSCVFLNINIASIQSTVQIKYSNIIRHLSVRLYKLINAYVCIFLRSFLQSRCEELLNISNLEGVFQSVF